MSDLLRSYIDWPNEMTKMTLPRTGARPLVGHICRIGHGYRTGTGTTVHVHILRRKRGGYVVYREYRTIWEGKSDSYVAVLCDTPTSVLNELGLDNMPPAEQEAWNDAVRHDDALSAINHMEI